MKRPHMILKRRYTSYMCPSPSHVQHQDRTLMKRWALVYNNVSKSLDGLQQMHDTN